MDDAWVAAAARVEPKSLTAERQSYLALSPHLERAGSRSNISLREFLGSRHNRCATTACDAEVVRLSHAADGWNQQVAVVGGGGRGHCLDSRIPSTMAWSPRHAHTVPSSVARTCHARLDKEVGREV